MDGGGSDCLCVTIKVLFPTGGDDRLSCLEVLSMAVDVWRGLGIQTDRSRTRYQIDFVSVVCVKLNRSLPLLSPQTKI